MNKIVLNDICSKITDGSHNPPKGVEFGLPMLSSKNITEDGLTLKDARFLSERDFAQENKRTDISPGDVLITIVGTIGRTLVVKDTHPKFTVQRSVGVLKPNRKFVTPEYLYYALKSPSLQKKLTEGAKGVAQQGIYLNNIKKLQVPLPSLSLQNRIVGILNAADDLRQKNRAIVAKYSELTNSLFLQMFGDPIRNPKEWKIQKLKNLCTRIVSGNTPNGGSKVYIEEGITFFRSQNVWRNKLIFEDIAFIDQNTHKKMSKSSLKHGDILMTKTGRINTENSSLGRAALFLGEDNSANINGHVYLIRLKEGMINEYVLFILTTDEYREHIRSVCVGGIDKRQLNKEHIEEFPIIFPPIDLQREFADRLKNIELQKGKAQKALIKSEELFNGLLHKAFTGELVKTKETVTI